MGVSVSVSVPAASASVGVAARLPDGTSPETIAEVRRLLLAEDAMLNVAAWASANVGVPADRRARMVVAAGVAAMFCRPFVYDNKRRRLDPDEWRARIADVPDHLGKFDLLMLRRDKIFAHADRNAAVVNVANTHRLFAGPTKPGDPIDLRVYDVGGDGGLLEDESRQVIAALATRLAELFSKRMVDLGAVRHRPLVDVG
jgi:hypothetical protein